MISNKSTRRDFLRHSTQAAAAVSAATALTSTSLAARPKQNRLKVGQIGVGHAHAAGKMQAFRKSPDWEVVGVVEPDDELRNEAIQDETYQCLQWMTEEELLGTPGLQAVAVETRVDRLLDVGETCVNAGMHIHLDKPPGAAFGQFRRLLKSADRQGLCVQMGYMYRYNPAIVMLRDLLQRGWLGEVFEVHAVMSKQVGESKRESWTEMPGGTMFELGCHLIDLLIGILGKPDKVTPYMRHSGDFDDDLLDNMLAVCEYPRATATIKSTALEVEGFDRRHLVVCGTEGTFHIQPLDDPQAQLVLSQQRGDYKKEEYEQITFNEYVRYVDDVADLASIVRGEKSADFNSTHDLAAQETLLKACGLPVHG